jgi:hypothetical protein
MLARARSWLTYANVISTISLFIVLGGGAYAATRLVGQDGRITGCVNKRSGAARIVAPGKKCKRGEKRINWNQRGPDGVRGAEGVRGPEGPPGSPDTSNFYSKGESDSRFLASGGTAFDSQRLGGLPSSAYVRGGGLRSFSLHVAPVGGSTAVFVAGLGRVNASCNGGSTQFTLSNNQGHDVLAWMDNGGSDASFAQLAPTQSQTSGADANVDTSGEHVIWHLAGSTGGTLFNATVYAAAVRLNASSSCYFFFHLDEEP